MPRTHKPYDATFRQQAVELAQTSGKPYRDVARDLGVSVDTLRAWRQEQTAHPDTGPVAANGKPSELTNACAANWPTPSASVKS